MFKDTKLLAFAFFRCYKIVVLCWFLVFILLAVLPSLLLTSPRFDRGLTQVVELHSYFISATAFGLGFIFHKNRPENWLNRLPVSRHILSAFPLFLLALVAISLCALEASSWEIFAGLREGSPFVKLVAYPMAAFAVARLPRNFALGFFGVVIFLLLFALFV